LNSSYGTSYIYPHFEFFRIDEVFGGNCDEGREVRIYDAFEYVTLFSVVLGEGVVMRVTGRIDEKSGTFGNLK